MTGDSSAISAYATITYAAPLARAKDHIQNAPDVDALRSYTHLEVTGERASTGHPRDAAERQYRIALANRRMTELSDN